MSEKKHDAFTILAFNFILPIVARKHAKVVSMVDIGKKTRIRASASLPEPTEKAVRTLMREYGYPEGSIDAAIHRALTEASNDKAVSTGMKLDGIVFHSVFFVAVMLPFVYFAFPGLRMAAIIAFLALLGFLMLRKPQYQRIRQICRFSKNTEEAQYAMLNRMLKAYQTPGIVLNMGRILLLIAIGAALVLTKDVVPYFN